MAYKVKQFRYYNDKSSEVTESKRNQPTTLDGTTTLITSEHYVNGDVFGKHFPVTQLGIQALPGTKFYLNEAVDPVIIGATGIYELDLTNGIQISKVSFAHDSMENIKNNDNAFLIVDIIYDDGEATV